MLVTVECNVTFKASKLLPSTMASPAYVTFPKFLNSFHSENDKVIDNILFSAA